ncbi:MAG: MCP four helix bundle domain-containing protein, partial [Planctomycetaceae bacterium]|nr:MCP four helix bundle domain-containing protein [Planctomycetaceae bacterium]
MLRRFRIRTRLFIAFSIVVFFTVIVGLTSFVGITSIGNFSEKTLINARMLSTIYVHNVDIDASVFFMLHPDRESTVVDHTQTTKALMENLRGHLDKYYESKLLFNEVFTQEEIQEMPNLIETGVSVLLHLIFPCFCGFPVVSVEQVIFRNGRRCNGLFQQS